jgi:hypothetical protein
MVKAEKGLLHGLGHDMGRGRVSTQLIFGVQTWAIGLSRQKNWVHGTKVCINSPSYVPVCSGWPLSQSEGSRRSSGVGVWIHCQLAGGPSWGTSTVGYSFTLLSWRCDLSFLEFKSLFAKWQKRKWFRAKIDRKWRTDAMLSPAVNLWASYTLTFGVHCYYFENMINLLIWGHGR